MRLGPRPIALSRLARAPPYACVALTLALLGAGLFTMMPTKDALLVTSCFATWPLTYVVAEFLMRRSYRKRGWESCAACKERLPQGFIEIVGFCARCGAGGRRDA